MYPINNVQLFIFNFDISIEIKNGISSPYCTKEIVVYNSNLWSLLATFYWLMFHFSYIYFYTDYAWYINNITPGRHIFLTPGTVVALIVNTL